MGNISVTTGLETYTVDEELFKWCMAEADREGIFRNPYTGTSYTASDMDTDVFARECNARFPKLPPATAPLLFAGALPGGVAGYVQTYIIDGAAVGITNIGLAYREAVCALIDVVGGLVAYDVKFTEDQVKSVVKNLIRAFKISLGV